jgi:membrane protease YdiL (CAAX protease family)
VTAIEPGGPADRSPATTGGSSEPDGLAPGGRGLPTLVRDLLTYDRRPFLILLYVPVALTLLEYVFLPENAAEWFDWARRARRGTEDDLRRYVWWGGGCLALLVVIPALLLRLGAGVRLREMGLRVRGTGRDALVYLLLYAIFAPVVVAISRTEDFRRVYPFFEPRPGAAASLFWIFQAVYCLQFFAVEFFFRGFMVLGLRPALGRAAVLVMIAPYCMIHYHKPMPEAFGAIAAGFILGTLAYRTRTILWGFLLHYAVALTMDLLARSS